MVRRNVYCCNFHKSLSNCYHPQCVNCFHFMIPTNRELEYLEDKGYKWRKMLKQFLVQNCQKDLKKLI